MRIEIQSMEIEREVDAQEFERIKNRLDKPEPSNKNDLKAAPPSASPTVSPLSIATPPTHVPIRRPRRANEPGAGFRRRWPAPTPLSAATPAALAVNDTDYDFDDVAIEAYFTSDMVSDIQ